MFRMKSAAAAFGALALGAAAPANASDSAVSGGVVIIYPDDPIAWTVVANATTGEGFTGTEQSTIHYVFTGGTGTTFNFTYTLENTSPGDSPFGPSIAVFGFNVTDPPLSVIANDADIFQEDTGGNFSGLVPDVAFCFTALNNCNGNGNAGVFPDDGPASGSFTVNFGTPQTSIVLSDFATRFQRTGDDFEGSASGFGVPMIPVPEPAAWAMMIAGFGMIGGALRARRRTSIVTA